MALLRIPAEDRVLRAPEAIRTHLAQHGIWYEQWPVAGRVTDTATADEILAAYAPEVDRLKARGGYVTADVIDVTADLPGLQAMLDRFNREHTHAEDEVRFIVRGRGLFHIHPPTGAVFALEVEAGDLINVPAGTQHWFDLCADRNIRAIRLFREKAGWTPLYTGSEIAAGFAPLCFGPSYLPAGQAPLATLPALRA
jgi:1,2-dihydroxy-3-keto-5-methylthiopentene dioxygenase